MTITVSLSRIKAIGGTVTDNAGVPQAGIQVQLDRVEQYGTWRDNVLSITTDQDGAYEFRNLGRTQYRVKFIGGALFIDEYFDSDPSPAFNNVIDLSGMDGPDYK